jgi:hypothetical protein
VPSIARPSLRRSLFAHALLLTVLVAGCGGGGGGPAAAPPPPPPSQGPSGLVPPGGFPDLVAATGPATGQIRLTFTAPAGPGGVTADLYEVRAQVRHLTLENVLAAPLVAHNHVPLAPGAPETLTLSGFEGGRTYQLALRAKFGAMYGEHSYAVAARARAGTPPAPPVGAIQVSGPRALDQDGATYVLTQDIVAAGTAFTVTARNVTFDLAGRTVTYGTGGGTVHGLYTEFLYNSGRLEVRNGRFVQGNGGGGACHAVVVRGGHDVRLTGLNVDVSGPDAMGLLLFDGFTGTTRIDHNTVACRTTVVSDRHFPGVTAIAAMGVEGPCEVDHNLVTASPQWGIQVQGLATTGEHLIHHNRVVGTRARVANGYGFGVHKPKADVFENEVDGESRGFHIDGDTHFGTQAEVHDNVVRTQDQPNAEYPVHWTHGIKIESAPGARVLRNRVTAIADPAHAEAIALDLQLGASGDVVVRDNCFVATSNTPTMLAHALNWTLGTTVAPNPVVVERNVFRSTDRAITRSWGAQVGGALRANAFEHDTSTGHAFTFEFFDSSDLLPSPGHRLIDAWSQVSTLSLGQWASPAAWTSTREATLRVRVRTSGLAPLGGAAVRVRDVGGALVAQGTSDAAGQFEALLVTQRCSNGPIVVARGPFQVEVDGGANGTWTGSVDVDGRTSLVATLSSGGSQGVVDATAPDAPATLIVRPVAATRLLAWWDVPIDATGLVLYEVRLDGALAAITETPHAALSGLIPGRLYQVSVHAVDAGGNRSISSGVVGATTWAEDRGP